MLQDKRSKAFRGKFSVLDGLAIDGIPTNRVALSLVHPIERIDVPISAIRWIEARQFKLYGRGKNSWVATSAFVEICIVPYIRERIHRLSKQIVGDPLEIVLDGETIIRPIVCELLGIQESLSISQHNYEDAVALANRLRRRWSEVEPKLAWTKI
jgi:hypothetical protein